MSIEAARADLEAPAGGALRHARAAAVRWAKWARKPLKRVHAT